MFTKCIMPAYNPYIHNYHTRLLPPTMVSNPSINRKSKPDALARSEICEEIDVFASSLTLRVTISMGC